MHCDTDSAGHQGSSSGSIGKSSWSLIQDNTEDLSGSKMGSFDDQLLSGDVCAAGTKNEQSINPNRSESLLIYNLSHAGKKWFMLGRNFGRVVLLALRQEFLQAFAQDNVQRPIAWVGARNHTLLSPTD
jgi:hypothetical protein